MTTHKLSIDVLKFNDRKKPRYHVFLFVSETVTEYSIGVELKFGGFTSCEQANDFAVSNGEKLRIKDIDLYKERE